MTENEALESALKKIIAQEKSNWGYIENFDVDENWAVRTAIEHVKQYRKIGTPEECREAIEKQKTEKPMEELGVFGEPEEKDIDRLKSLHHKILYSKIAEIVTEQEMIALLRAKDALKKQLSERPFDKTKPDSGYGNYYENARVIVCPNCNGRLKLKSKGKYCDKCGQKLNWEV